MKYGVTRKAIREQAAFVLLFLFVAFPCTAQKRDLNYYIDYATGHSPLIRDLQNQVASNSLDSLILRANYHPQVTGTSANAFAPVIAGFGYDPALTTTAFTTLVNVEQKFIGRKNLATQYQGFALSADSIRNARQLTAEDLKRTITSQYITAFGDQEQLNFNLKVHHLLSDQEILFKKLTQSNVYKQTEYLTFLVTYKQQELQLKQIRIQFQSDYAMLNYLCGIFDTTAVPLEAPDVSLHQLQDQAASIFFMRYMIDSIKLLNSIAILNYSYRPKLSAFANGGWSSTLTYHAEKNFGVSAGINVTAPIYDGHQQRLQTQKLKLLENTNAIYRDFFQAQYSQQIAMLRQQLAATEALTDDVNEQLRYTEGLINVNQKMMGTGDVRISDFIIALNNYLTAKNLLTQNYISRLQIINQFNYWNR